MNLFDSAESHSLRKQAAHLSARRIADMLQADPGRPDALSCEAAGLHLDFSRHLLDRQTLDQLLALASAAAMPSRINALFMGDHVNTTEDRPALHMLLRASSAGAYSPTRFAEVHRTRQRMREQVAALRDGARRGFDGEPISDVVNIGIGGSDLGPRLATEALASRQPGEPRVHYAANIDPEEMNAVLAVLNPGTTLFIVCSKSFSTEETRQNALAARAWLLAAGAGTEDIPRHFLAVTSNLGAAADFGIPEEGCFPLWDWVGGRYSLWSAVGLSTAIAIGWEQFSDLLRGAESMDAHFQQAAPENNLPLLMSLLEIWCCNFLGAGNHAVLPYAHRLARLPDFLQQLSMESNGKSVSSSGEPLGHHSAPVLWGAAGTIGQHSFHQLLHQGTLLCPIDFILPLAPAQPDSDGRHARLVANCLAQSSALLVGRSAAEAEESLRRRGHRADAERLAPHLVVAGNRPHSILSFPSLTPRVLGALLALYEHRTFCSSVIWGINAFDQWGVELGKEIGRRVHDTMLDSALQTQDDSAGALDRATLSLIRRWRKANA